MTQDTQYSVEKNVDYTPSNWSRQFTSGNREEAKAAFEFRIKNDPTGSYRLVRETVLETFEPEMVR